MLLKCLGVRVAEYSGREKSIDIDLKFLKSENNMVAAKETTLKDLPEGEK